MKLRQVLLMFTLGVLLTCVQSAHSMTIPTTTSDMLCQYDNNSDVAVATLGLTSDINVCINVDTLTVRGLEAELKELTHTLAISTDRNPASYRRNSNNVNDVGKNLRLNRDFTYKTLPWKRYLSLLHRRAREGFNCKA